MKKRLPLLFLLSLILIITSCANPNYKSVEEENRGNQNIYDKYKYTPTIKRQDIPETPSQKRKVDVLFLMYMDGDNNLEDDIYMDLKEAVYGYSYLTSKDNVEVIILWDGDEDYPESKLYKIGLNHTLYDLSDNISWLYNGNAQEVGMNNVKTLENYLKWANNNYDADSIIFQFSDHGVGPGDFSFSNAHYNRAACQDIHSDITSDILLGTQDVRIAIENSGLKKVDLVIQDVCLGSTIEEIYEYKDVADYMLVSPNLTPAAGQDYINLVGLLAEGKTVHNGKLDIEEYMNLNIYNFMTNYKIDANKWNYYRKQVKDLLGLTSISDLELSLIPFSPEMQQYEKDPYFKLYLYSAEVGTMTGIKVSEVVDLKEAIDNMAELLITNGYAGNTHKIGPNEIFPKTYYSLLKDIFTDILNPYHATSGTIFDIGFIADELIKAANNNNWPELVTAAQNVKNKLDNIIIASWRDGVGGALYNKTLDTSLKSYPQYSNGSYGIAIASNTYIDELGSKYKDSLLYAKDSKWVTLMSKVPLPLF